MIKRELLTVYSIIFVLCIFVLTGCENKLLNQENFDSLIVKANKGDNISQSAVGDQYYYRRNYEMAIQWYKKALASESIKSAVQSMINKSERKLLLQKAQEYYNGNNLLKAREIWEKLATHGDSYAQYKMGELLEYGCKDIPQDIDSAIKWYYRSA